jgi:hypothetical protein
MLYATAVAYDDSPADWQHTLPVDVRQRVLLRLVGHTEGFVRRLAVRRLATFSSADISTALVQAALADPDEAVRDAAAQAIALDPVDPEALAQLTIAASAPGTTGAALAALTTARDLQPSVREHLPKDLRRHVQRQVWAVRWRRHWHDILATTLRGMQGGFAGLGLGIGLFLGLYSALSSGFEGLDLRWQAIISLMSVGVPLAGLIGMLAAGSGSFVGVVLRSLQDREWPWRTWLATTVTCALALGLGFILMASVFSPFGEARPLRSLLAGTMIGLGLAGAATVPWKWKGKLATPLRLSLATAAGIAAFVLAGFLGLIFDHNLWWLLLMGIPGSAGFFWGLNPSLRNKPGFPPRDLASLPGQ